MIFLAKSPLAARYDLTSVLQVLSAAAPLSKETELEACRALGINLVLQGDDLKFPKQIYFEQNMDDKVSVLSVSLNLSSVKLDKTLHRPDYFEKLSLS